MYKEYLERIIYNLREIEVYSSSGMPCADYEEGMDFKFTDAKHTRSNRNLFHQCCSGGKRN